MNTHSTRHRLPSILLNALIMALVVAAVVLAVRGQAAGPAAPTLHEGEPHATAGAAIQASNYCVSCHTAGDERLLQATEWRGGIAMAQYSACPAYRRIQEELYYTERLLLMIDRAGSSLGESNPALASRLQAGQEGYLRLLDQPVNSLEAFVAEAQGLRFKLGKVYSEISQAIEQGKRTRTAIVAVAISLLLALAFGWGWYNTRHVPAHGWRALGRGRLAGKALLILLVFVFFALPLLREPAQPAAANTPEAQAMQAALDTSQRAALTADRALARAWMLGHVGAAWNTVDPQKGQALLNEALAAAGQAQKNQTALWGQAATAQEAAVADPAVLEKAGLIAGQVHAMRARSWQLSLIAQDWAAIDAETARSALHLGEDTAVQAQGIYRDLDLRKLAVQTALMDGGGEIAAGNFAAQIYDPAVRAWAWREIAAQTKTSQDYEQAAAAARQITDPVQKAVALARIAAQSGAPDLFKEARQAVTGQDSEGAVYAWMNLAILSQDAALVEQIPVEYPAARAAALTGLGRSEAFALAIDDPYEAARAQAQVIAVLAENDPAFAGEAAGRISLPLFADRARRDLILAGGDPTQANLIQSPYLLVQALGGQAKFSEAAALAGTLKDAYPLVKLAIEWSKTDPQAALALVDQMQREADRAQALIAIAAQTKDPAIFERTLGMALAARVRGDALAPARASLNLALAFLPGTPAGDPAKAQAALEQAYQAALSIAIK